MAAPRDHLRLVTSPQERRKHKRFSTFLRGTLFHGMTAVECVIDSISAGGVGIVAPRPVAAHEIVALHIEGYGMFPGQIAWRQDTRMGIRFYEDPARVAERLALAPRTQGKAKQQG